MRVAQTRLAVCLAVGLCGFALFSQAPAQVAQASDVFHGKRSDLKNHPFRQGGLVVTINGYHKTLVGEIFDIKVENPTAHTLPFDPLDILVVNSDGFQFNGPPCYNAAIAPGAFLEYSYQLFGGYSGAPVNFVAPFRIYWGDSLLAEVAD